MDNVEAARILGELVAHKAAVKILAEAVSAVARGEVPIDEATLRSFLQAKVLLEGPRLRDLPNGIGLTEAQWAPFQDGLAAGVKDVAETIGQAPR